MIIAPAQNKQVTYYTDPLDPYIQLTSGYYNHIAVDEEVVLDDTLVSRVYEIVDEYGKEIIFYSKEETYDADTGAGGGVETQYTRKVTPPQMGIRYIENDLVKRGACLVYLPALSLPFTPILKMKVVIDSVPWRISRKSYIYSITEVGLYKLMLVQ